MLILFLTSQPHEKIGSLGLYNFWCLVLANLCTVVEKIVGPLGLYRVSRFYTNLWGLRFICFGGPSVHIIFGPLGSYKSWCCVHKICPVLKFLEYLWP